MVLPGRLRPDGDRDVPVGAEAYGGTLGRQRPVIDPLRNAEAAVRLNVIAKAEATWLPHCSACACPKSRGLRGSSP
jgi:hypothetical protein